MNGRIFVNNVSLGLYAEIVASPAYRDAKADTTLAALPKMLGPGTEPFDLRFEGPDGTSHRAAHLIQVSNGPYGKGMSGIGKRPRLDTGLLGILALVIPNDKAASALIRAVGSGHAERYDGLSAWDSTTFRVDSESAIAVGLDGETMALDPPLTFTTRPGALRVRRPAHAIGYSPSALATTWHSADPRPLEHPPGQADPDSATEPAGSTASEGAPRDSRSISSSARSTVG